MSLGAGQMASVLGLMHPEVDEGSLAARMKYFHRRDFPSAEVAVGKGWRAEYGPAGLTMVVYAFELLAAFVPPAEAIDLVRDSWKRIEDTARAAWLERDSRRFALPVLVRGVGVGPKGATSGSLVAITADDLRGWLQGRGDYRATLVMDALRLARDLDAALGRALPDERAQRVREDLERWSGARGRS